jgi:cytochrome c oxidase assembly protein subunit 15
VWLITLIVVTGGAVRLTNSGLGCTDWPTCTDNRVVAPLEMHAWIEFGNRLVTGLVSVAVVVAVLGALRRTPRRRDLTWLSLGLVAGVIGQIILGGLVVLFHLWPPLVMGHFVLSQLLVADAVVLHHRAKRPDDVARVAPKVAAPVVALSRAVVVVASLAILTGTVVTGAGPHSGSHGDDLVKRLPFPVADVARVHGVMDMTFIACVLWLAWLLRRTGAPAAALRACETGLLVGVLQAVVGYTQYFTGVPVILVATHILGATVLWIAVLSSHLGLFEPADELRDSDHGAEARSSDASGDGHTGGDRTGRDLVAG